LVADVPFQLLSDGNEVSPRLFHGRSGFRRRRKARVISVHILVTKEI
jgi:hypothetical protein